PTEYALPATAPKPADCNFIANLPGLDSVAEFRDNARDFVAGSNWGLRAGLGSLRRRSIGVADSTCMNRHTHKTSRRWMDGYLFRRYGLTRLLGLHRAAGVVIAHAGFSLPFQTPALPFQAAAFSIEAP